MNGARIFFLILGIAFCGLTILALRRGELRTMYFGISKEDQPAQFWSAIAFYILITAVSLFRVLV